MELTVGNNTGVTEKSAAATFMGWKWDTRCGWFVSHKEWKHHLNSKGKGY